MRLMLFSPLMGLATTRHVRKTSSAQTMLAIGTRLQQSSRSSACVLRSLLKVIWVLENRRAIEWRSLSQGPC
ncbi:hypothetical protein F5X99DRAFT_215431 [Biscogniauxia marginata]|nr:hypothetical protein F5X99DRAFT_215431 [Biscogniauxia marginata]